MPIRWLTLFLDLPGPDLGRGLKFWCDITDCRLSAPRGDGEEFVTLLPPDGSPYLRAQRLDRGGARVHLDLHLDLGAVSLDDVGSAARELGAEPLVRRPDQVTLASPGGFVFCLVPWEHESEVPAPVRLDRGGSNRADQLCLDVPADLLDVETTFWHSLTGWPLRHIPDSEFSALERPPGIPLRLLFQRRDVAAPGDRVTGHVDFACDDRETLLERHLAAGARVLYRAPRWITLVDPVGSPYCLTVRDPWTGLVPSV